MTTPTRPRLAALGHSTVHATLALSLAFAGLAVPTLVATAGAETIDETVTPDRPTNALVGLHRGFVENVGQWHETIRFRATVNEGTVGFERDGYWISMPTEATADSEATADAEASPTSRYNVRVTFVEANPGAGVSGLGPASHATSFFRGSPDAWTTGARSFRRLEYRELWPGIDARYRAEAGPLKYEFAVAPGADPSNVRLRYEGATSVESTADGGLRVRAGHATIVDGAPIAWQNVDSERSEVPIEFRVERDDDAFVVSFELGAYRPDLELILDPALYLYSGLIGGAAGDALVDAAIDSEGALYVVGYTDSGPDTFPVVVGPDAVLDGFRDAYIAKVLPDGSGLAYCGYLGGSGSEHAAAVEVDSMGRAYVAGDTNSEDFPTTVGPDTSYSGDAEAFVLRVSADGTSLEYSGFIGGVKRDVANGLAINEAGEAFVVGITRSNEVTFPVLVGPDLEIEGRGASRCDSFVAKVLADGSGFAYCGYVGGASHYDWAYDVAVDPTGRAIMVGLTRSDETSFPVTVGPDLTLNGTTDGFVAAVSPDGSRLEYCGYIGGSPGSGLRSVVVDDSGRAHVAGHVIGGEGFPVTVGPDLTHNGELDAFVARVSPTGDALEYCGFIGGAFNERNESGDIALDEDGYLYVTGGTVSTEATFPVSGGIDDTFNGEFDVFLSIVTPDGSGLVASGFFGGADVENASGIAVGSDGSVYLGGYVRSTEGFPLEVGPDLTPNSGNDVFVARLWIDGEQSECRAGTVDLGNGLAEPVLTANGRVGGPFRTVRVGTSDALDLSMAAPPAGPVPSIFALYAWREVPEGIATLPQPYGIGFACLPTPLDLREPAPSVIWNNTPRPRLGRPDFPSTPAPSTVLSLPAGVGFEVDVTFQGIILDFGSAASVPASLTNAIVLEVRD